VREEVRASVELISEFDLSYARCPTGLLDGCSGPLPSSPAGIGTSALGPGIENPVALYKDGVYYGMQLSGFGRPVGYLSVAVHQRPQGTLFGRNATAGLIQFTTRDPRRSFRENRHKPGIITSRAALSVLSLAVSRRISQAVVVN